MINRYYDTDVKRSHLATSGRKSESNECQQFPADPPGEGAVVHGDGGRVARVLLRYGARRVRRRGSDSDRRAENLKVKQQNWLFISLKKN